jgi:BTB/POZ domain-containing protein 1/2
MLLTQARLFDEPQLAALCLEMIDKNTTEALGADGFTDIDLDTLNAVLERDTLRIREAKLFQAVVRYGSATGCIRKSEVFFNWNNILQKKQGISFLTYIPFVII